MVSKILSSSYIGIESYILEVEADIMAGLPSFNIVGLADVAIYESKERVRAAVKNSGYEIPARRIVINLSPAGIRKEGASFDLSIAIGILASLGEVENKKLEKYIVLGELSLNGNIRKIDGYNYPAKYGQNMTVNSLAIALQTRFSTLFQQKDQLVLSLTW